MDIIEILKKHDYLVDVFQHPKDNGCMVHYPQLLLLHNKQEHITHWQCSYKLDNNKLDYNLEINDKTINHQLDIPNYAQRLYIDIDINKACEMIKYNTNLIRYFNKYGDLVESLLDIVDSNNNTDEVKFCELFKKAVQSNFDKQYYEEAKKQNLDKGYEVCCMAVGGEI